MQAALARHDHLLREAIQAHSGTVVKSRGEGDSFFAVFPRASDAVAAALAIQRALLAEPWLIRTPLRVRMALHTGEAQLRGDDYFGPAINRCARLRAAAHGGQILLSGATEELTRDQLPNEVTLRDLGERRLKDLARPERVFQLVHPELPADFPPLRSLEAFSHNLPIQLTSFIGREPEIAEVRRLLATTRLLTLTGAGGCGKTRLALQVAAELVEEYADGVWLVELAALADPVLVTQTVASTLGLREEPGRPLVEILVSYLRPRSLLLLLDNCEHLIEASARLAEALLRACPNVRILATSREALGVAGETPQRVPSLLPPDLDRLGRTEADRISTLMRSEAARLFVERAQTLVPSFALTNQSAVAVAQVCQRLDGIPLAIELAAARVKVLAVEQIAARLDDMFRLLTGGSRTALPRQQTLQALIDWSYNLLPEPERMLLRRLSVFAGGWSLAAAEAVCAGRGLEEWEVLDLLSRLIDKSLVMVEAAAEGETRYRLLETVRQYSQERLLEAGETEGVRARHAQFFLRLAEEAWPEYFGPRQAVWLARLEEEHDNLRAAFTWSQAGPEPLPGELSAQSELGLRLAASLWWFWFLHGYLSEGRRWLEAAIARAGGVPAPSWECPRENPEQLRIWARVLHGAGGVSLFLGEVEASHSLSAQAVALFRDLEDADGLASSLRGLAWTTLSQGNGEAARPLIEESLTIYRALGDKHGIARSLNFQAHLACLQGDHEAARALWQESLLFAREAGDNWTVGVALVSLGKVAEYLGDWEAARTLYGKSLAVRQALGDRRGTAECLEGLAAVAAVHGHLGRAARLLGAVEVLREALGAPLMPHLDWHVDHEPLVAAVHAGLGEAASVAWAEGRGMTLAEAIAEAVGERGG